MATPDLREGADDIAILEEYDWLLNSPSIDRSKIPNLASASDLHPGVTIRIFRVRPIFHCEDYRIISEVVKYCDHPSYRPWHTSMGDLSIIEGVLLTGRYSRSFFLTDMGIQPIGITSDGTPHYSRYCATSLLYTVQLPK